MIDVDANLFRIVSTTAAKEETRYYLNGVYIEPHPSVGAILVATDGHRMIIAYDEKSACSRSAIVRLPRYALAQCRMPKMFEDRRRLLIDPEIPGTATIQDIKKVKGSAEETVPIMTVHNVCIDGKFPDWRRVLPQTYQDGDPKATCFNPSYLKEWGIIGVEIGKMYGTHFPSMQIALSDGASPVILRWNGAKNIFGVQMPMRDEVGGIALPDFMNTHVEKAVAA